MKKLLIIFTLILLFLSACLVPSKISNYNFAYLYNGGNSFTKPEFVVFHKTDSLSVVFFKVNLPDFLYTKNANEDKYSARFKINYELYNSYKDKILLDSASFIYSDSSNFGLNKALISNFNIKAKSPKNYILKITLTDLNKNKSLTTIYNVYKKSHYSRQNFLITTYDNLPIFKNYIAENGEFKIICNDFSAKKLYVRYYKRIFPITAPPFAENKEKIFKYRADSVFMISLKNNETKMLNLPNQGFYHFQIDTSNKEGITLFRFYEDFPLVSNTMQMIFPLRYITTKKEFDKMFWSKDYKAEVDNFWIKIAGNKDRAKILIKNYYNRVQNANKLFTSYLEGWKTDRGIIYIVYGPPNIVYKSSNTEKWIYGEQRNSRSIIFNFVKVNNPFTDNDYNLIKHQYYKESWYNAIENWRR